MRTEQEMMDLILGVAKTDERIQAVLLVGSRANPTVPKDSYREGLARYQLTPVFRVLVPERNVCLQRDINRECWTAGAEYVDRWYGEQQAYLRTDPEICIDSSQEALADTFANYFQGLLQSSQGRKCYEHSIY